MINGNVFYHGSLRKTIVAFGSLFSDIYIDRKEGNSVTGPTVQRLQIPLAYAPKEKWLVRLEQDPDLTNNTYISLPRMSFEVIGYTYDPQRKLGRVQQIKCGDGSSNVKTTYTPVPYNIDVSLYVLTKTQEDAMQIIEQILPTFTPEYNLVVKTVPEMNIIQEIPVILNSVSVSDEYDGDFQTRRFVTHTLNFTLKMNMFGNVDTGGIIETVNANIGDNEDFSNPNRVYTAAGEVSTATVVSESWTDNF